jgi:predicted secreted protein
MDSTNKWRQFLDGMLDAGEASVDLVYDGSASGNAEKIKVAKTLTAQCWHVTFNDGGTSTDSSWKCLGWLTGVGHAASYDGAVTQTLNLKFTGAPTYTDLA